VPDIILLAKSFIGLVAILGILVFLLFYKPSKAEKKQKEVKKAPTKKYDAYESLEDLVAVIRNRKSSTKELQVALDKVIKYHGTIHKKLGVRLHPDFNLYGEILLRICRHPHTNKDLILNFDRELEKKNPDYVKDINDFLTKGLNSRGF